jgi:hypothetical protein
MANQTFLALVNGIPTQSQGTVVSTGIDEAGKVVHLDAQGLLDVSVLPPGIGADVAIVTASEALSAGDFVNIWDNMGDANVRRADASVAGKEAHGFVLEGFASGTPATVYFEGTNHQVGGQTPGPVYLSDIAPGAANGTPPTTAGHIVQRLGVAVSASAINAECGQHYIL